MTQPAFDDLVIVDNLVLNRIAIDAFGYTSEHIEAMKPLGWEPRLALNESARDIALRAYRTGVRDTLDGMAESIRPYRGRDRIIRVDDLLAWLRKAASSL